MSEGVSRAIWNRWTITLIVIWVTILSARSADTATPKTNSLAVQWSSLIQTNFPILPHNSAMPFLNASTSVGFTSNNFSLERFSLHPIVEPPRLPQPTNSTSSLLDTFSAETAGPQEITLDLYREQHEAINGAPLLTVSPRAMQSEPSSRFEKVLNRFLPKNGAVFGRNPNARHDPLLMGNDW